jgi:hypothetical protein
MQNPGDTLSDFEAEMGEYTAKALISSREGGKVMFGMKPFDELPDVVLS